MLGELLNTVEWSLKDLGRILFPSSSREQTLDEIDRLGAELQQRCADLARSQRELAGVKRRLRDNPIAAALLRSRIEELTRKKHSEQAWLTALELDQLRQSLVEDERACPRLEQRCWSLHFHIRQLQRRLDRALQRLTLA
jgi:chromosome segregation ATPase